MQKEKIIFIIPRNYNEEPKLLGVIKYSSVILLCVFGAILVFILKLINISILLKIYIFMFLFIPFSIIIFIGDNNESLFRMVIYLYKFYVRPKVYLFNK